VSGPKTSRYTLTAEQRRILAEQRKIERRKAVATETIKRTQKRLLQIGGMFGADKQIAAELISRTGSDNGLGRIMAELDTIISAMQPLTSRTNYDDVSSVESTASKMKECLASAEKLAERIAVISTKNELGLKVNLQAAIDEGFATSFADIQKITDTPSSELKESAVQKLRELRKIGVLPKKYIVELDEALDRIGSIDNEIFIKNLIALTVNPLIKKVKLYATEYAECKDEFETLNAEYIALCDLYYYVAQEFPCSKAAIATLRAEVQRIKDAVAEDDEQAYISECLDEVMTAMGYSVLGSREVTKRNGKRFRNELYLYGEGTAVNITYSSDGRIAMELGGIDTSDRIPTARETAQLCDSMEQFCGDFREIEKRLLTKGVVLADRVSLLPPDAEYAQIINTTDYSMKTETETISFQKQRRSTAKQKTMRRE
jgi:hypothetical protein